MTKYWVKKYLDKSQVDAISEAVRKAELGCRGDIVPMIVRRSSAIRHVPVVLSLSFALLFLGLEFAGLNGWYLGDALPFFYQHWIYQVLFFVVILALAWWWSHLHPVQRLLTSNADEVEQVERRAQLEFFLHRLNQTKGHTAVLIFISVMERRAVILADEGIAKKLPNETWNEVLKPLSESLRQGQWSQGFEKAIAHVGELLKTHFPVDAVASAGQHEISNALIIKE